MVEHVVVAPTSISMLLERRWRPLGTILFCNPRAEKLLAWSFDLRSKVYTRMGSPLVSSAS